MWKKYKIEENKIYCFKSFHFDTYFKNQDKKWDFCTVNSKDIDDNIAIEEVVEEADIKNWQSLITESNSVLSILPALPNLPLVIKPMNNFTVFPNTIIQLYISIPIWIQYYAGSVKNEHLMIEQPVKELSNTWLGDYETGVLAYSLKINPNTILDKEKIKPYEALCPLKIANNHNSPLDFQRFLLHVDQLSLYIENDKLYTNEVQIKFKGESMVSDVNYSSHCPSIIKTMKKLSDARNPEKGSALKRSFYFLKSLTQY